MPEVVERELEVKRMKVEVSQMCIEDRLHWIIEMRGRTSPRIRGGEAKLRHLEEERLYFAP